METKTSTYRLGSETVEARQHDGTDESADAIAAWVRAHKGTAEIAYKGQFDYDLHSAYLMLLSRSSSIVRPYFWVVKTADDHFYAVYPDVFRSMFDPLH